jgi:hypothetical protein
MCSGTSDNPIQPVILLYDLPENTDNAVTAASNKSLFIYQLYSGMTFDLF